MAQELLPNLWRLVAATPLKLVLSMMKIETAIKQLKKECDFLGIPMFTLLPWIQKDGRMVFSERTMEAYAKVMETLPDTESYIDEQMAYL